MGKFKIVWQSALTNSLSSQKRDLRPMAQLCLVSKAVAKAAESRKQKENEAAFNMKQCRVLEHNTRQKETHGGNSTVIKGRVFI